MPVAVHSALWVREWGEDLAPHVETAADLGFDGVEISLLGLDEAQATRLARVAADLGVTLLCTTGLSADEDVTSTDPARRRTGADALRRGADLVAACGASQLCGVIHAPWGPGDGRDREGRLGRSAEVLAEVAPRYRERGITLGVEAVNRFESDLVNTAEQARDLVARVDQPNVGVHLDTFHMNIEERSIADAIGSTGHHLVHVHVVDNHRGAPGQGHIDFDEVFAALGTAGYDGWLGLELFVVAGHPASADLTVWRDVDDATDAARRGLAFVRAAWAS